MTKRKPKKKATEMTTEEAMKHLFPKKVREELYRIAHEKDDSDSEQPSQEDGNTDAT
jgi:hypothetical protein